jgi:hypothetical protein
MSNFSHHQKVFLLLLTYIVILLTSIEVFPQDVISEPPFIKLNDHTFLLNEVEIDINARTLSIPCKINMAAGLIEVVLCRPEGKTHESLLVTNTTPLEFNTAMLLLGFDPVNEVPEDASLIDPESPFRTIETPGDSVLIYLETEIGGVTVIKPVEHFIYDMRRRGSMEQSTWLYRGVLIHMDYAIIGYDVSMIATYHDLSALIELNEDGKFNDELFYVNEYEKLVVGQQAKLIIKAIY